MDQKTEEVKEKHLTGEEYKRIIHLTNRLTKRDVENVREIIQDKIPRIREEVIKALNA
jgi:hypothetical protein